MLSNDDQKKLNMYLLEVEKHLSGISVSDRSDILLELDSHIKESLSSGNQTLKQILTALGDPVIVANHHLLVRGVQPLAPKKRFSWGRAIAITMVGFFAVIIISTIAIVKSLSPIISIDEENERVVILGGLIDIDGKNESVSVGNNSIRIKSNDIDIELKGFEQKLDGTIKLENENTLEVSGQNGKWKFLASKSKDIEYKCELEGLGHSPKPEEFIKRSAGSRVIIDLGDNILTGSNCKFKIPEHLKLNAKLGNGKLKFDSLQQEIIARVNNGKIQFNKHKEVAYNINAHVTTGTIDGVSSRDQSGHKVDLKIVNGKIKIK